MKKLTKKYKISLYVKKKHKLKLYKNNQGIRMLVMPCRNEIATASIYFYLKVGSKYETLNINGISHFIEHMCFKGSTKFPSYIDITKTFDDHGISFNAFTNKDITAYHYKFISTLENLDIICKITSDMIMHPLMKEHEIKIERNVIIQEYNNDQDDIDCIIDNIIDKCIFNNHPLSYPIIGTLQTINSINRQQLINYHKKYYIPENLVIGLSGKIHNEYFKIIEKYFGGIGSFKNIKQTTQGITDIIPFIDYNPLIKVDCYQKKLKQDYIYIFFKTNGIFDPLNNYYKLLQNILGINMSSRLFIEIREKLGLVYSIKCGITKHEEVGFFDIHTQNESKDTLQCINAILKELVKFKTYGIKEDELQKNKNNYCDYHQSKFDDIEYENEYYAEQVLLNKPIETLEMRINSIQEITSNQLQKVANDLFDLSKIHIITFGKAKKEDILKVINKYL